MSPKSHLVCLAVLVVTILATNVNSNPEIAPYAASKSHHMVIGYRQPGDKLVFKQNIVKTSSWMKIVTHQQTFYTSGYDRITQIQALDQKTNGNGAHASLLNGGPGHQNATLRFKSKRGHGINFVVEIYARP